MGLTVPFSLLLYIQIDIGPMPYVFVFERLSAVLDFILIEMAIKLAHLTRPPMAEEYLHKHAKDSCHMDT